jgi:hypothetical protein
VTSVELNGFSVHFPYLIRRSRVEAIPLLNSHTVPCCADPTLHIETFSTVHGHDIVGWGCAPALIPVVPIGEARELLHEYPVTSCARAAGYIEAFPAVMCLDVYGDAIAGWYKIP